LFQSPVGVLENVVISQEISADYSAAAVDVSVVLGSVGAPCEAAVSVYWGGRLVISGVFPVQASAPGGTTTLPLGRVDVLDPVLWWPRGFGEPHLYTLRVVYESTSAEAQTITRKIGLRTVELVQDPVDAAAGAGAGQQVGVSAAGEPEDAPRGSASRSGKASVDGRSSLYTVPAATFYLQVNGVPIFAKGANFIPMDVFPNRVTQEDRAYMLHAAAASNMNMIRVWGGGLYQPDDFYDLADELGLMVWQEMMLACALYPRNDEFLSNVAQEVVEQVTRLASHPSIVVWGGNNENEVALGWFSASNMNRDLYVSDYSKLYGDTVYSSIRAVDGGQRVWVDSSPSNGLLSADPYAKLWGSASTETAGDTHYYNYQDDCEETTNFQQSRFVSEFGFQAMPSFLAYQPVTIPEDWKASSDMMEFRQRHEDGNSQIRAQIERHFLIPPEQCPGQSDVTQKDLFDSYLYLTQVQQSRCYETGINKWRQMRSEESVQTMGILYWQLNDIWQGASWSSIEWNGRWKPLQYMVRRAYADISVSFSGPHDYNSDSAEGSDTPLEVWAVNDLKDVDVSLDIVVKFVPWSASESVRGGDIWSSQVLVPAGTGVKIHSIDVRAALSSAGHGCSATTCFVQAVSAAAAAAARRGGSLGVPVTEHFLTAVKYVPSIGQPVDFEVSDFSVDATDKRIVRFALKLNQTNPFVVLELSSGSSDTDKKKTSEGDSQILDATVGWFNDNNFVGVADTVYAMSYTYFRESNVQNEQEFMKNLQIRSLQSVPTSC
jgi:beta-mannosidase